MNRMDEYTALLAELEQTPEALNDTVSKALNRQNTLQKKRRFLGTSLGGLAACFATFVLLVNLSTPFARPADGFPFWRIWPRRSAGLPACPPPWRTIMCSPSGCPNRKTASRPGWST